MLSRSVNLIPRSILLSGAAVLFLSMGRTFFNIRGASVLMGIVASFYKFLNVPFFSCMILAVILLGCTFEGFWYWLIERKRVNALLPFKNMSYEDMNNSMIRGRSDLLRFGLVGCVSVWITAVILSLFFGYIIRYSWWATGISQTAQYIFIESVLASAFGFFTTIAGQKIAQYFKNTLTELIGYKKPLYWILAGSIASGAGIISVLL
jgi:hypothetical protein